MTVTELKPRKKGVTLLCTDKGEWEINTDTLNLAGIKKDDIISEEKLKALLSDSEYDRAKSRALWYLSRGDCTKKALCEKLCRAFSEKAAEKAVIRMEELGLVDDRKYAVRLSQNLASNNISKREIRQKLYIKGVPRDIIDEVLCELETNPTEQIAELINRKYRGKLGDENSVKKVYAALIRKGFSYSDIKAVLKDYSENLQNSEEY